MAENNKYRHMQNIVNKYVTAYKSDFDIDKDTLDKAEPDKQYLWIVRKHGTNLIPKEEVATSDEAQYYIENRDERGCHFYEIDTNSFKTTIIHNIEKYMSQCKQEYDLQQMYKDVADDFDYGY